MKLPDEIAARLKGRLTLDVPEAGALLGCGRRQAYELAHSGRLPTLRLTEGRVVVPLAAFLRMLGFDPPDEESPSSAEGPSPTPVTALTVPTTETENSDDSARATA